MLFLSSAGYNDIAFNFLIGDDGNVYEGRGWEVTGQHTPSFNEKSLGFAFIGNFDIFLVRTLL
jgi:N-acetylmuramoyl-L-alanine amidase